MTATALVLSASHRPEPLTTRTVVVRVALLDGGGAATTVTTVLRDSGSSVSSE